MTITAKLSRRLYEALGDDAAHDMVDWMQRVDAQRTELREFNELNFARFDARLGEGTAQLQAAIARHDARFDQVEAALARHDARFDQVEAALARHDARFDQVEVALARHDARFDQVEVALARHDARFDQVEAALARHDALFGELRREMETGFARLETRIEQRTADIMKWSFVFWIGSVVTLVGALRLLE